MVGTSCARGWIETSDSAQNSVLRFFLIDPEVPVDLWVGIVI